jgi:hypothetical protein
MFSAGFQPAIPAIKQFHTYALDGAYIYSPYMPSWCEEGQLAFFGYDIV